MVSSIPGSWILLREAQEVAEHIVVVFTQARRRGGRTPGALGEPPGGRDLRVRSYLWMVDHIPEASGREMWIDERFAALEHRPSGDAVRLQEVHGLIMLALLRPGRQNLVEFDLMVSTCEHGCKPWLPRQVGLTDRSAQPVPLVVRADGDGDPHIIALTGIDALWHQVRVSVAQRTRHAARPRIVHDIFPQHRDRHLA